VKTYAYRLVQQGPFYSWKILIFTLVVLSAVAVIIFSSYDDPQIWREAITYILLFIWIISLPTFPLIMYGKYYADKLDLPPLEEKYVPLPNLGYIIMAGIGGFGLIKWLLGW
jgi:hypothetical protein